MQGLRTTRTRVLVLAVFIAVFLYYSSSWTTQTTQESARLAIYMNVDAPSNSIKGVKSSFDWSSVKYQHAAGELKHLPVRKGPPLPAVQHKFKAESKAESRIREARRTEISQLFQRDWQAYRKHAWMKDALLPISSGYRDQFSGWAATLVDSLDALWIMGMKDEFEEAVAAVATIDFGQSTSERVNTFETNIRYLGGLLSAYDLSKRPVLLKKARELGDLLYGAFNTVNRMPVDFIDFERAKTGSELFVEGAVVSASPGSLSLELTRLSQITGDPKYYDAITRLMNVFYKHQNETLMPGLWPMMVSMSRQDVVSGNQFIIAGSADSLYEYLPKMTALLGGADPMYGIMAQGFLDATDKHLLFRPMLPDGADILVAGNVQVDEKGQYRMDPEIEHLSCFIGGSFALGGRLLGREKDVVTGDKLARGCAHAYKSMASGVGPERWNLAPCKSRTDCKWIESTWIEERKKRPEWKEHLPKGYTTAKDSRYILRPEAIESVFLLYRITGDPQLQEIAWDMFEAVKKATATEGASAAVMDVTVPAGASQHEDYMESFWLAETLKYFYLALSPPDLISLDDYVFNTEAHPFLRSK